MNENLFETILILWKSGLAPEEFEKLVTDAIEKAGSEDAAKFFFLNTKIVHKILTSRHPGKKITEKMFYLEVLKINVSRQLLPELQRMHSLSNDYFYLGMYARKKLDFYARHHSYLLEEIHSRVTPLTNKELGERIVTVITSEGVNSATIFYKIEKNLE